MCRDSRVNFHRSLIQRVVAVDDVLALLSMMAGCTKASFSL